MFEVVVIPGSIGEITNTATVSSNTFDPVATNNSSSVETEVLPAYTITTSDIPDPVKAGETFKLYAEITNNSITAIESAQLIYTRPTQFRHQSMTFNQGSCVRNRRVVTCDYGSIAAGVTAQVEITLLVKGGVAAGVYDNPFEFSGMRSGNAISESVIEQTTVVRNANLIVVTRGKGGSTVTSVPDVVNCPGDCRENGMSTGDVVTLTATADDDSVFQKWAGVCKSAGTDPVCTVTLKSGNNRAVARFIKKPKLTVRVNGKGAGSVASDISGISCPGDCDELYDEGTIVTLTATADAGSSFSKWAGACKSAGTDPVCQVEVSKSKTARATFVKNPIVTVVINGAGSISSDDGGIACPGDCEEQYSIGETVTFTATPDAGSTFSRWRGACRGRSPVCTLDIKSSKNLNVRAVFR